MQATVERGSQQQTPKAEADLAYGIISRAQYALRWNPPDVAAAFLAKAKSRGSLAASRMSTRLAIRELGLASGSDDEQSPGMAFAIPLEDSENLHKMVTGSRDNLQWWYVPRERVEEALTRGDRSSLDKYVYRAALGYIVSGDDTESPSSEGVRRLYFVNPIDASSVARVAKYMKEQNSIDRVPSRREVLFEDIFYQGRLGPAHGPKSRPVEKPRPNLEVIQSEPQTQIQPQVERTASVA